MKVRPATVVLTVGLLSGTAHAQYRCIENGRTILTDRPCSSGQAQGSAQPDGRQRNVLGDAANSAYATATDGWRGQAQYQATRAGVVSQEAHTVVPLTMEIDPQRKILGSSPENGCKLKGLATGLTGTVTHLDVTFSGCAYPGFNRRMSGTLAVYSAQKHAQLLLTGFSAGIGKVAESFDIRATLRR